MFAVVQRCMAVGLVSIYAEPKGNEGMVAKERIELSFGFG